MRIPPSFRVKHVPSGQVLWLGSFTHPFDSSAQPPGPCGRDASGAAPRPPCDISSRSDAKQNCASHSPARTIRTLDRASCSRLWLDSSGERSAAPTSVDAQSSPPSSRAGWPLSAIVAANIRSRARRQSQGGLDARILLIALEFIQVLLGGDSPNLPKQVLRLRALSGKPIGHFRTLLVALTRSACPSLHDLKTPWLSFHRIGPRLFK